MPQSIVVPKVKCRTVWLSDIHLGFKDCKADYLLDFLQSVECETLYLLGDIVDLWSLKKTFFWPPGHYEVIKLLFQKAKTGTRVIYIPGNHDEALRDYVGHDFGPIETLNEAIHITADGKRMLLFHGDCMDAHIRFSHFTKLIGDTAYNFLLFINRWANFVRRAFGFPYWSLASYLKNRVKNARQAIEIFENAVANEAKRRGLDGVICGHIHQAEIRDIDGILYCNDGDWIESCTALVEDELGQLELLHWSDKKRIIRSASAANDENGSRTPKELQPSIVNSFYDLS